MSGRGTVTILFTDLVGSTELLDQLGDDAAEAVRRTHFQLLREAVAASGGEEVKSLGDGLMVVFPSALDAIGCAVGMQQAVQLHNQEPGVSPLLVRVGLHAGEPIRQEDDYFGTPVVVAKRLCERAEGGQIVASELVRALVGSRGSFSFRDLGTLPLKGLANPPAACEIVWRSVGPEGQVLQPVATPSAVRASARSRTGAAPTITRPGARTFLLWAVVGVVLVAAAGIVVAVIATGRLSGGEGGADKEEITVGEARFGDISSPGEIDGWTFQAVRGQIVSIGVETSEGDSLDPFLELAGPGDAVLAFDEYGGLYEVLLPEEGRYTAWVRSSNGLQTGAYRIDLSSEPAGNVGAITEPPTGQGAIELGQTGFGDISSPGEIDGWTFQAVRGQIVSIGVEASEGDSLDPFLELAGPGDAVLAFDEYGGLYEVLLPEEGRYTAWVRSSNGLQTGAYRIDLSSEPAGNVEAITEPPTGQGAIELGQTGFGAIGSPGEVDGWTFQAAAGQAVTISIVTSRFSPFDPFLKLVGPDGSVLLASDDDYFEGVLLPESGDYTAQIGSSDGLQTGLYRVGLE